MKSGKIFPFLQERKKKCIHEVQNQQFRNPDMTGGCLGTTFSDEPLSQCISMVSIQREKYIIMQKKNSLTVISKTDEFLPETRI